MYSTTSSTVYELVEKRRAERQSGENFFQKLMEARHFIACHFLARF